MSKIHIAATALTVLFVFALPLISPAGAAGLLDHDAEGTRHAMFLTVGAGHGHELDSAAFGLLAMDEAAYMKVGFIGTNYEKAGDAIGLGFSLGVHYKYKIFDPYFGMGSALGRNTDKGRTFVDLNFETGLRVEITDAFGVDLELRCYEGWRDIYLDNDDSSTHCYAGAGLYFFTD